MRTWPSVKGCPAVAESRWAIVVKTESTEPPGKRKRGDNPPKAVLLVELEERSGYLEKIRVVLDLI
jgi:hypothetical protein